MSKTTIQGTRFQTGLTRIAVKCDDWTVTSHFVVENCERPSGVKALGKDTRRRLEEATKKYVTSLTRIMEEENKL